MDNIVPSRFSCLKIEDDDFRPVQNKSSKKKVENKQLGKKPVPANTNKHSSKQQQQSSNTSSKKTKSKVKHESKQWEEWKKKDTEYMDENFEQDLQSAIFQSKLDYENQKKNDPSATLEQDKNSKKKKNKTMSLDQFLGENQPVKQEQTNQQTEDEDFFESVLHSAKEEIRKEKVEAKRKERSNNIEEIINLAHCQEELRKEKEKNEQLSQDLEQAKKDITIVKKRNKMLCNMLSQGEMKDKATVLLELEKLTLVKEELTEEVAKLHKLLEQERSKSHACSTPSNNLGNSASENHAKQKKKKKT